MRFQYRTVLRQITLSTLVCLLLSSPALAEKRIALVVGNSNYQNVSRLNNPANDARLMADTLRSLGFTIVGNEAQIDLEKAAFDNAVRSFGRQLQGADVGLFYYAGHGLQVRGANYLVPVNANPEREADLDFELEDVDVVLRQMEGAGTRLNIVFLDACRNNPFGGRGLRAIESGLAQMRASEGTLISFATEPGNVALDGNDGNSPFTSALAQTIQKPGLGIFDVLNEVGLTVKRATAGSQQPWFSSSPISGPFYFASAPDAPISTPSERVPVVAPLHVAATPPPSAKVSSSAVASPITHSKRPTSQQQPSCFGQEPCDDHGPSCFGPEDCKEHPNYVPFGTAMNSTPVFSNSISPRRPSQPPTRSCFGPEDCKEHPGYVPFGRR
jgi:hypothetical protein